MKGSLNRLLLLSACALCACGQGDDAESPTITPSPEPPQAAFLTVGLRNGEKPETFDHSCEAFSEVLVVRSNRNWKVEISGGETSWLHVEKSSAATVDLSAAVNTGRSDRRARIRFYTSDREASVELAVNQQGSELFGGAPIRDLLLIYVDDPDNGPGPDKQRFEKLVAARIDGEAQWLFDGFLFLGNYFHGRSFMATGQHSPTRRQDWLDMLDRLFAKQESIPALDEALEETRRQIPGPFHRRKVVIFLPDPQAGQTDWGEINGRQMDFNASDDRILACNWYVDRILERFAAANLRNIQLAGIYWLTENGGFLPQHLCQVARHVHDLGLEFYWIPYYEAFGYDRWKEYGFDRAWYQPNYLFQSSTPRQRLIDAWQTAQSLGMSIEMEFDSNYPLERNTDYVDVYEQLGLFDTLDLAYYGDDALAYWQDGIASEQELFRRIAGIIAQRQQTATTDK